MSLLYNLEKYFVNLGSCFTTKAKNYMTKSYYYQVNPVKNSYPLWCAFFAYILLGNSAIMLSHNGFLHTINFFIN